MSSNACIVLRMKTQTHIGCPSLCCEGIRHLGYDLWPRVVCAGGYYATAGRNASILL